MDANHPPPQNRSACDTSVNTNSHESRRPQQCPPRVKHEAMMHYTANAFLFLVSMTDRTAFTQECIMQCIINANTRNSRLWHRTGGGPPTRGLEKELCCGWKNRPPDMEGSCENTEQAVSNMLGRVSSTTRVARGQQLFAVNSLHVMKCHARQLTYRKSQR